MREFNRRFLAATVCATAVLGLNIANAATVPPPPDASAAIVRTLTMEAQQAYLSRDFATAQAKYKQALALAAKSAPKAQIVLLSNLGAAYREDHKYPEAEDTFKRAIAMAQKSGLSRDSSVQVTMKQYAHLLRKMHRTEEADAMEARAAGGQGPALVVVPSQSSAVPTSKILDEAANARIAAALENAAGGKQSEMKSVDQITIEDLQRSLQHEPNDQDAWVMLAYKYKKAKNYPKAIETFKSTLGKFRLKPDQEKFVRLNLAHSYFLTGNYSESADEAKRVIALDPEEPEAFVLASSSYSAAGDIRAKYEVDQQFVQKFPNHPRHSAVSQALDFLKRDIEDQSKAQTGPSNTEWQKSWVRAPMPLKIYVHERGDDSFKFSPSGNITAGTPFELIQSSLDAWVQASQGRIQYTFTPKLDDANISVFFTSDRDGLENEFAAGVTDWDTEGTHRQARVKLLTIQRDTGDPVDRAKFYDTCLHELGHAFGLEHSSSVQDVMYRAVHPQPLAALSDNDRARIIRLYTYP